MRFAALPIMLTVFSRCASGRIAHWTTYEVREGDRFDDPAIAACSRTALAAISAHDALALKIWWGSKLSRPNNIDKPRQRGHFTRERLPIRPTSWRDNALLLIKGNEAITSEIHDEPKIIGAPNVSKSGRLPTGRSSWP